MSYEASRYHDFSYGHKVTGHESKCRHLHGHNGRVTFFCRAKSAELDTVGRVIDFSDIKSRLCEWLEDNWDHRFLVWEGDADGAYLTSIDSTVVVVPFNPTAENMAYYLVEVVAPKQLEGTGIECYKVVFEETRKCSASYAIATRNA